MAAHRIKLKPVKAAVTASFEYKEQLKQMTDKQLVQHRIDLMLHTGEKGDEYWSKMWSINTEMAQRFSKAVRHQEEQR